MKKFEIEIGGNNYIFEMNRTSLLSLSTDSDLLKLLTAEELKNAKNDERTLSIIKERLNNLSSIEKGKLLNKQQIQSFYCALLKHHPNMTYEEASDLYDAIFEEYGNDGLDEINANIEELQTNFTQKTNEGKDKKRLIIRKS